MAEMYCADCQVWLAYDRSKTIALAVRARHETVCPGPIDHHPVWSELAIDLAPAIAYWLGET